MPPTAPKISGGSSAAAVTTASAHAGHQRQVALQKKLAQGAALIPEWQRNAIFSSGAGEMPLDAMFVGKFDSQDDSELNEKVAAYLEIPNNDARYGQKITPVDMLTTHFRQKAEKNDELMRLQLARQTVDNRDPASAERAFKIFPALERVPRDYLRQQVSLQLALWELLFVGEIKGQADHDLVYAILRDDIDIPISPIWDPIGITASALQKIEAGGARINFGEIYLPAGDIKEPRQTSFFQGLFGVDTGNGSSQKADFKLRVKVALLQRLYPNLRNRPYNDVMNYVRLFTKRVSTYYRDGLQGEQPSTLGSFMALSAGAGPLLPPPSSWETAFPNDQRIPAANAGAAAAAGNPPALQ